jgi:hypothetical protein
MSVRGSPVSALKLDVGPLRPVPFKKLFVHESNGMKNNLSYRDATFIRGKGYLRHGEIPDRSSA